MRAVRVHLQNVQRKSSCWSYGLKHSDWRASSHWILIRCSSMQLCGLPAEAGGCSCGGPKWVEVLPASLCLERQTAPCTQSRRVPEPCSLISNGFLPVDLKVMSILLPHLMAPPFLPVPPYTSPFPAKVLNCCFFTCRKAACTLLANNLVQVSNMNATCTWSNAK